MDMYLSTPKTLAHVIFFTANCRSEKSGFGNRESDGKKRTAGIGKRESDGKKRTAGIGIRESGFGKTKNKPAACRGIGRRAGRGTEDIALLVLLTVAICEQSQDN